MIEFATIPEAREYYDTLFIDAIPLHAGTKDHPLCYAWGKRDVYDQWKNAPPNANIAIRSGGLSRIANLECDDRTIQGTSTHVRNHLIGLGYENELTEAVSASGGSRHFYVVFDGSLPGNYRKLSPDYGAGEFRYGPGSYTAAPPSNVGNGIYRLVSGDFTRLPRLELVDILPLLSNKDIATSQNPAIPRTARAMLAGKFSHGYQSRSEQEQALIAALINANHSFHSIYNLFIDPKNVCAGKFAELHAENRENAKRWLYHSYNRALEWALTHESAERQAIQQEISLVQNTPWPGRTGAVDKAVYIAHLQLAYRACRMEYAASVRDLAELAGVSIDTASAATRRLCVAGYLTLERKAVNHRGWAKVYGLNLQHDRNRTLPHTPCVEVYDYDRTFTHDAFRSRYLGKSGAQVFSALLNTPLTIDQLVSTTGRTKATVKRAIKRMSKLLDTTTGEVVSMVNLDGEQWKVTDGVDLNHVSKLLRTAGKAKRQQEQHAKDRRRHKRSLNLLGNGENSND